MNKYLCNIVNPQCIVIAHCSKKCDDVNDLIQHNRLNSQKDFIETFDFIKEYHVCPVCHHDQVYFQTQAMRSHHHTAFECLFCRTHFNLSRQNHSKEVKLTMIGPSQGGLIDKCRVIDTHELVRYIRHQEEIGY
jgi:transcription elongation factor Elf1